MTPNLASEQWRRTRCLCWSSQYRRAAWLYFQTQTSRGRHCINSRCPPLSREVESEATPEGPASSSFVKPLYITSIYLIYRSNVAPPPPTPRSNRLWYSRFALTSSKPRGHAQQTLHQQWETPYLTQLPTMSPNPIHPPSLFFMLSLLGGVCCFVVLLFFFFRFFSWKK